ncbi:MAG: lamin tail domain-containing protein [Actinomycetes bacterium]
MTRRTSTVLLTVLALLAGTSATVASPASAARIHHTRDTARVVRVLDGDTIDVDRNRDGRIDARIRLLGIDAPERGLCNAAAATRALKRLLGHKVVTLVSDSGRIGLLHRPERLVIVPVPGGEVDASTWLLERGLGVWMPRDNEFTLRVAQHQAADRAAAAGLGWFDEDRCGAGPGPNGSLHLHVQYQADAAASLSVTQRRNQEFIRITNTGPAPVNVDGWTLRVGNIREIRVPRGGAIPAGGTITVHVGRGTNRATDRYLGRTTPMLTDANLDGGRHMGTGSYLIDRDNDIRAHMDWPCTLSCADPTGGTLTLSRVVVNPTGTDVNGEMVSLTNQGAAPVSLGDTVLEMWPHVYEFPPTQQLQPGETLTVHAGRGTNSALTRYVGSPRYFLPNSGGRILLRTYDAIVIDCVAWGSGRCPA